MALLYSPPARSPTKILRALLYDLGKRKGSFDIEVCYDAANEDDSWCIVVGHYEFRYDEAEATIIIQQKDDVSAPIVTYNHVDAINHIFSENPRKNWHVRIMNAKELLASYANPILEAHTQWIFYVSEVYRLWKKGNRQNDLSIAAKFDIGEPTLCITSGSYTIQQMKRQPLSDLFDVTTSDGLRTQNRWMLCPKTYGTLRDACKACFL